MGADEDLERAAKVARAWTLHRDRWSSREIGQELGVSHVTAQRWVEEARQAAEWAELEDRAGKRMRMREFLDRLAVLGIQALTGDPDKDVEPRPYAEVVPVLLKVTDQINRLDGNYAAVKYSSDDDRRPPDPALLEAMEHEARRAELADAEDQRRELES